MNTLYMRVWVCARAPDVCVNIRVEFVAVYQNWNKTGKKFCRDHIITMNVKNFYGSCSHFYSTFLHFFFLHITPAYISLFICILLVHSWIHSNIQRRNRRRYFSKHPSNSHDISNNSAYIYTHTHYGEFLSVASFPILIPNSFFIL